MRMPMRVENGSFKYLSARKSYSHKGRARCEQPRIHYQVLRVQSFIWLHPNAPYHFVYCFIVPPPFHKLALPYFAI